VFKGTYRHRIDPKGRLPVPAAFRRALGKEPAVIVTVLDQCLAVYPPAEWARLETQLGVLPAFSRPVKALTRLLLSRAADCELDVQGRILLPPALRESAGLGRDAVVVGVLSRFEIWSPDSWEGFVRESERLLDDVSLDIQWPLPPATPTEPGPTPPEPRPGVGHPQAKPKR
jgi:MraZ protein